MPERRFDYSLVAQGPDDSAMFPRKYSTLSRRAPDPSLNLTSPINARPLNASFESRYKQSVSFQSTKNQSNQLPTSQQTQIKVSQGYSSILKSKQRELNGQEKDLNKTVIDDKRMSQTLKGYRRDDRSRSNYNELIDVPSSNFYRQKRQSSYDLTNKKKEAQPIKVPKQLQENVDFSNIRLDHHNHRKQDSQASVLKEVNQKELFQKIGRINRLNQEINSRLQRMLCKIETYE